jgi:hypothetical protein
MELQLEVINKILSNLDNLTSVGEIAKSCEKTYNGLGRYGETQGEWDEYKTYYKFPNLPLPENIFLEVTECTNSYGSNERISKLQFVEEKPKTIITYEPI